MDKQIVNKNGKIYVGKLPPPITHSESLHKLYRQSHAYNNLAIRKRRRQESSHHNINIVNNIIEYPRYKSNFTTIYNPKNIPYLFNMLDVIADNYQILGDIIVNIKKHHNLYDDLEVPQNQDNDEALFEAHIKIQTMSKLKLITNKLGFVKGMKSYCENELVLSVMDDLEEIFKNDGDWLGQDEVVEQYMDKIANYNINGAYLYDLINVLDKFNLPSINTNKENIDWLTTEFGNYEDYVASEEANLKFKTELDKRVPTQNCTIEPPFLMTHTMPDAWQHMNHNCDSGKITLVTNKVSWDDYIKLDNTYTVEEVAEFAKGKSKRYGDVQQHPLKDLSGNYEKFILNGQGIPQIFESISIWWCEDDLEITIDIGTLLNPYSLANRHLEDMLYIAAKEYMPDGGVLPEWDEVATRFKLGIYQLHSNNIEFINWTRVNPFDAK